MLRVPPLRICGRTIACSVRRDVARGRDGAHSIVGHSFSVCRARTHSPHVDTS
jgi:hypothetical protein